MSGSDQSSTEQKTKKLFKNLARILIAFAIVCFFYSCVLNGDKPGSSNHILKKDGQIIGPIHVKQDQSVYSVRVKEILKVGQYSTVNLALLDANKKYLFSFGDDLWAEEGYDSEGYWKETKEYYDIKLTIPEAGKYFLQAGIETSKNKSRVHVEIVPKNGSSLPFLWLGVFVLITAIVMNLKAKGIRPPEKSKKQTKKLNRTSTGKVKSNNG